MADWEELLKYSDEIKNEKSNKFRTALRELCYKQRQVLRNITITPEEKLNIILELINKYE